MAVIACPSLPWPLHSGTPEGIINRVEAITRTPYKSQDHVSPCLWRPERLQL